jgi:hypothetical protein
MKRVPRRRAAAVDSAAAVDTMAAATAGVVPSRAGSQVVDGLGFAELPAGNFGFELHNPFGGLRS